MSFKKHGLIFLLLLTIFVRLYPIYPNLFPFMFDHAKDSLIIMQMGTKLRPTLVGAVTSIPGVYYGPAWYYLALPLNMLMGYAPLASVLTVILLATAGTWLSWKYLGKLEAALWATSFGLVGSQTSAWSPYLTPLITLPVLILLLNLQPKKPLSWQKLGLLSLLTSLCFHFQPAFAVVLLPLVILILILLKQKISWRSWLLAAVIFVLPFTPHLIFELRHDFHQTKQIVNFFSNYQAEARVIQANTMGMGRLWEVGDFILGQAGNSFSPMNLPFFYWGAALVLMLIYFEYQHRRNGSQLPLSQVERRVFYTFLVGTWLLYQVFPLKQYYLVAIIPLWMVLFARVFKSLRPSWVQPLMWLVVTLSIIQAFLSRQHFIKLNQAEAYFLAPKEAAIRKVYELNQGKPFAVYHYLPELYDYPYQLLYRQQIMQGKPAPVEYSYASGEVAHMAIVAPQITQQPVTDLPADIFLIVERPSYDFIFDEWWGRVASPLEMSGEYKINESLTVYQGHMER